ncbi:MAG: hypothetical protein QF536_09335 [Arenicellales bacterium]|nr:hypothetical protein [Arenicellales bacterium]
MSDVKWKQKTCDALKSHAAIYKVEVAAALWCGVPPDMVDKVIGQCKPTGNTSLASAILRHPEVECIEVYCRAIFEAMDEGVLSFTYEDGRELGPDKYVKYGRRHVKRGVLKDWIAKEYPGDKPDFLFDEIERGTHKAINAESFRALQVELEADKKRLQKADKICRVLGSQIESLQKERDQLLKERETATRMVPDSVISSLLKMVLGMAVNTYKYDPDANRNSATGGNAGSISADLQSVGLTIDADTVRKYLNEAADRFKVILPK